MLPSVVPFVSGRTQLCKPINVVENGAGAVLRHPLTVIKSAIFEYFARERMCRDTKSSGF